MKKLSLAISVICLALTLQSCPSHRNDPQNVMNTRFGCAYILSVNDTVQAKFSDVKEYPHTDILYPSIYPKQVTWYPEQDDSIQHSANIHELRVKKLTDNGEVIIIESSRFYINDEYWALDSFTDPADTIREVIDALGQKQTIVLHKKPAPYNLNDVIEQLELNYPQYVHRFSDLKTHNFSNWEVTMHENLYPRIYLKEPVGGIKKSVL